MATLKELQNKISSLQKTHKITSAMQLIAATKFNRSLVYVMRMKNYRTSLLELGKSLADVLAEESHPLAEVRKEKRVKWIAITSDRGLCGAFNSNVNRMLLSQLRDEKPETFVDFFGKKGMSFFASQIKNGVIKLTDTALQPFPKPTEKELNSQRNKKMSEDLPSLVQVRRLANRLTKDFLSGKFDRICLAYNYFDSTISQKPVLETLLPFSDLSGADESSAGGNALFEPDKKRILSVLIEKLIAYQLYFALLSSAVGEHAARMTAMDNASKNCEELIDEFTLMRNRARQAAITTELVEIISGSESLKK